MANHPEQLKIALEGYVFETIARIPAESELAASHQFSARFERRMRRLIKKLGQQPSVQIEEQAGRSKFPRSPTLHKRKKLLAAAIVLAILISVFSITVAREAVIGFFVHIYESFSTIAFNRDPAATSPTGIDDSDALLPEYIPEGFTLTDRLVTDKVTQIYYTNGLGDVIMFSKSKIELAQLVIDTEDSNIESIKNMNANLMYYSNKGVNNIIWQSDLYLFRITSKLNKETLLKMAESTNRPE